MITLSEREATALLAYIEECQRDYLGLTQGQIDAKKTLKAGLAAARAVTLSNPVTGTVAVVLKAGAA
ncbi:hypothetical protein Q0M94_03585 [Deinococcus radiomollis]|uniref:hypothetical protein n=1 Tax=Deinococcus radiomollis TaxID=468916 RepID=UPI0038920886